MKTYTYNTNNRSIAVVLLADIAHEAGVETRAVVQLAHGVQIHATPAGRAVVACYAKPLLERARQARMQHEAQVAGAPRPWAQAAQRDADIGPRA